MERRNCSYALHFCRKCSEQMPKQREEQRLAESRHMAPLKRVPPHSSRVCGALLHSSIQRFFPASCNGNPHRAMETPIMQRKATHRAMEMLIVQWKVTHRAMESWILQQLYHRMGYASRPRCYLMIPYCTFMSKMRSTD